MKHAVMLEDGVAWSDMTVALAEAIAPYCASYGLEVSVYRGLEAYDRQAVYNRESMWNARYSNAFDGITMIAFHQGAIAAQVAIACFENEGSLYFFFSSRNVMSHRDRPVFRLGNLAEDLARELQGNFGIVGGLWVREDFRGGPTSKMFLRICLPLARLAALDLVRPEYLIAIYLEHLVKEGAEPRFQFSKCVRGVVRESPGRRQDMWLAYADPVFLRATARHIIAALSRLGDLK